MYKVHIFVVMFLNDKVGFPGTEVNDPDEIPGSSRTRKIKVGLCPWKEIPINSRGHCARR